MIHPLKIKQTQLHQTKEAFQPFSSIHLLPAIRSNPHPINMKPNTNQLLKILHLRSTDMTFSQNAYQYISTSVIMNNITKACIVHVSKINFLTWKL
ncbi:hypothetical protein Calkr_2574 [Caldicellulosiruptor acetigenus I77R1B]|uniref:Uncharacterized protein n=1 Tax=Caldicellulosiruptor acetigenus (strain ATCC 700853 / DSM 12137 / I77R1B) TaxID=632335 RepID=E4S8Z4_CALA7|nr:hypothetical protein Calkr_2574 [Caldicellulosiruptor acetigenus I77R1B]